MKRVLMLSFRPPVPLTEGFKLRAYHLARILGQRYALDLLTFDDGSLAAEHRAELGRIFRQVISFPLGELPARLRALRTLVSSSSRPLQVGYYRSRPMESWLLAHYREYDLFFGLHLRMAPYLEELAAPKAIDLIDAASLFYEGARHRATGPWRFIYTQESRRALAYERKILRTFPKAFISSRYDADHLGRHTIDEKDSKGSSCQLVVLPNGVREELLARGPCCGGGSKSETPEPRRLVFLGKMDYAPNVDAAVHFAREVFASVRKVDPELELEFWIVGTSPRPEVRALQTLPGVRVTGFMEDPFSIVERAALVVVPLRYGAGIQNKVLEAMALGKAVLTTPPGVRGIEGREGEHFEMVRHEGEWPDKIERLLQDEAKRRALGQNARRLIEERYRWDRVGRQLLRELEGLC